LFPREKIRAVAIASRDARRFAGFRRMRRLGLPKCEAESMAVHWQRLQRTSAQEWSVASLTSRSMPARCRDRRSVSRRCVQRSRRERGGEVGELVITQPMPSMPLFFWVTTTVRGTGRRISTCIRASGGMATSSGSTSAVAASCWGVPTRRSIVRRANRNGRNLPGARERREHRKCADRQSRSPG